MLHLAKIAKSFNKNYTLVFLFCDGEEFGMLGSLRYMQTHPAPKNIIAAISLDNLGKKWANGIDIAQVGQFRGYGPLWLSLLSVQAAKAVPGLWTPHIRGTLDQILQQAVPISFMDQGPFVARGVPALGFSTLYPQKYAEQMWRTYHSEYDLMQYQSPQVLQHAGRICEALLRQLLYMQTFPKETGAYLYLDKQQVFRGTGLWLLFILVVAIFFVVSYYQARQAKASILTCCRLGFRSFLRFWLPLVISFSSLYVFVAVGLMDAYHLYPATAKDPEIFKPHWPAVLLFIGILSTSLYIAHTSIKNTSGVTLNNIKSCAFFIMAICALYVLYINRQEESNQK